jgi:hypothetical protein
MRKFLKGAVVTLIVASMVFSTIAVTANTMNEQELENMYSKLGKDYTPTQTTNKKTITYTGGARDTILFESFEDEWVADSDGDLAPPGWETHILNAGGSPPLQYHWCRIGPHSYPSGDVIPTHGEWQTMVQWDYGDQDEWLITPEITLGSNSELTFEFYGHYGSTNPDHYYVKVSPTGGYDKTDFTDEIWDATTATPVGDNHYDFPVVLDLSVYDGTTIRVAWQDWAIGGLWYSHFIDAVEVTGDITQCEPDIDVEKKVLNPKTGAWEDADTENTAIDLPYCTNSEFKIIVTNTGDCPLSNITIKDIMSDSLEYLNATPIPDFFQYTPPEYHMEWYIDRLEVNQTIEIIIYFHVVSEDPCEIDSNHVIVEGKCLHGTIVTDEDWCYVHIKEKSKEINRPFLTWLQNHPNMFPLIQKMVKLLNLF